MIPHDFEDYIKMTHHIKKELSPTEKILNKLYGVFAQPTIKVEYSNTNTKFTLFRRTSEDTTTEQCLKALYPECLFLDSIERKMYFKGKDGKVYNVNFEEKVDV